MVNYQDQMAKQYIPRDNAKKTYMDMNRNRQASTSAAQPKPIVKPRAGQTTSTITATPIPSIPAPSSVLATPVITSPKPLVITPEPTLQQVIQAIEPLNAKIDALITRTELLGQGLAHMVVLCNTMLNVLQVQTENEVDDLEDLTMDETEGTSMPAA